VPYETLSEVSHRKSDISCAKTEGTLDFEGRKNPHMVYRH